MWEGVKSSNSYRVVTNILCIDKKMQTAQTSSLQLGRIRNGAQLKLTCSLSLTGYHFGQSWHMYLKIVFIYPAIQKMMSPKIGLSYKVFPLFTGRRLRLFYVTPFWGRLFQRHYKRKTNMAHTAKLLIRRKRLSRLNYTPWSRNLGKDSKFRHLLSIDL